MENLNFDQAMEQLEAILNELENSDNLSEEEINEKLQKAEELKNYCKGLLKAEKEEIIRVAKENNIPLEEIGLDENSNDFDDEDEEDNK